MKGVKSVRPETMWESAVASDSRDDHHLFAAQRKFMERHLD